MMNADTHVLPALESDCGGDIGTVEVNLGGEGGFQSSRREKFGLMTLCEA